jgi:hypothetical protein
MHFKFVLSLIAICLITSCSEGDATSKSEAGLRESDIYKAIVTYTNSQLGRNFPIISAKKLSCSKVGSAEFICLVELTLPLSEGRTFVGTERYRLIKTDGGIRILEKLSQ